MIVLDPEVKTCSSLRPGGKPAAIVGLILESMCWTLDLHEFLLAGMEEIAHRLLRQLCETVDRVVPIPPRSLTRRFIFPESRKGATMIDVLNSDTSSPIQKLHELQVIIKIAPSAATSLAATVTTSSWAMIPTSP